MELSKKIIRAFYKSISRTKAPELSGSGHVTLRVPVKCKGFSSEFEIHKSVKNDESGKVANVVTERHIIYGNVVYSEGQDGVNFIVDEVKKEIFDFMNTMFDTDEFYMTQRQKDINEAIIHLHKAGFI